MSKKSRIDIEELLRDIVQDEYCDYEENGKYVCCTEETLFLSTLMRLFINQKTDFQKVESEKSYTLKEMFRAFIEGKKKSEFYYNYSRNDGDLVLQEQFDYDTIEKQIRNTFGAMRLQVFKEIQINEKSALEIIEILRLYHHPFMASLRNFNKGKGFSKLKIEDYTDYIEKRKKLELERSANISKKSKGAFLNEDEISYKLEMQFGTEIFKEFAAIKSKMDKILIDDMRQIAKIDCPVMRKEIVSMYETKIFKHAKAVGNKMKLFSRIINTISMEINDTFSDSILYDLVELYNGETELANITAEEISDEDFCCGDNISYEYTVSEEVKNKLKEFSQKSKFACVYKEGVDFDISDFHNIVKDLNKYNETIKSSVQREEEDKRMIIESKNNQKYESRLRRSRDDSCSDGADGNLENKSNKITIVEKEELFEKIKKMK